MTSRQEYRSRGLLITPYKGDRPILIGVQFMASASPQRNGRFLAAYYVRLHADGTLASCMRCEENAAEEKPGYQIWYVYLEIAHDSPWF